MCELASILHVHIHTYIHEYIQLKRHKYTIEGELDSAKHRIQELDRLHKMCDNQLKRCEEDCEIKGREVEDLRCACACMYACMYVCVCVYMYMCVCVCVSELLYVYAYA
jgi:hypothetical protein